MPQRFLYIIYMLCLSFVSFSFFHPAALATTAARKVHSPRPESLQPNLDFSLHRLGSGGPTLLVIGGIQGDEPGGFSAASLLATNYTITTGQVWVVPNLNFPSIIARSRGTVGDMNRKFAYVDPKDPDYASVKRVQKLIQSPEVNLVLNLHDGSGFYRPQWEGPMHNPKRWGQCVIIDQDALNTPSFGHLENMAKTAVNDANQGLLRAEHRYHVYNTETSKGNAEMAKTLSYFAVRHGKPAFGIEASKNFTTEFRTYYHIHILESFMRQMGIAYTRSFPLTLQGVKNAINSDLAIALNDKRFVLPLENVRPSLAYVPLKKGATVQVNGSKPILTLVKEEGGKSWRVAYGNRTLTRISPQYLEYDYGLPGLEVSHDGNSCFVPVGEVITVEDSFMIQGIPGYRVNAIGALKEKADGSECGVVLRKKDFIPRFSIDKGATTYRVEVYKNKAFAGMILVRFGKLLPAASDTMTATKGQESSLGR